MPSRTDYITYLEGELAKKGQSTSIAHSNATAYADSLATPTFIAFVQTIYPGFIDIFTCNDISYLYAIYQQFELDWHTIATPANIAFYKNRGYYLALVYYVDYLRDNGLAKPGSDVRQDFHIFSRPTANDYQNYLSSFGYEAAYNYGNSLQSNYFNDLAYDVITKDLPTTPRFSPPVPPLTFDIYSCTDLDILKAIDDRIAAYPPDPLVEAALNPSNGACRPALRFYVGFLRTFGLATYDTGQVFHDVRGVGNVANPFIYIVPKKKKIDQKENDKKKEEKEGEEKTTINHPLNLILYGPPGTGKTYNSINYAVAIIENEDIKTIEKEDRDEVRKRYFKYVGTGQIVFTTFHQSMSYEDFIEGIKPEFDPSTNSLTYPIKPGIFKQLIEEIKKPKKTPLTPIAARRTKASSNENEEKVADVQKPEREGDKIPRYVMIIDEINRGNVSQIFGELITLIEEDKREGNQEAMSAILPYSKEKFSVPNNLYILGTMNTADRSVEALDTALRRRFSFKEMMPKNDKVSAFKDSKSNITYDLPNILDTINKRIAYLKDREHQIGHSYFIGCDSEEKLKSIFKDKIVPLLQEYFYGNVEYIGLTLGGAFVKSTEGVSFPTIPGIDNPSEPSAAFRVLNDDEWENLNIATAIAELMK